MKASLIKMNFIAVISFLFLLPTPSISFVLAERISRNPQQCQQKNPTRFHALNSQSESTMEADSTSSPPESIRVLALHGSEGDAEEFPNRLTALNDALAGKNMQLEITAVQGPLEKGPGFCWWNMPPGVRSFTAKEYEGFEESATKVLETWRNNQFDVVLGHSQGAILIASLLALQRAPYHPRRGYIMNGVAFPNPYTEDLAALKVDRLTDDATPKVLFVLGRNDKITPNSSGEQLREGLAKAGFQVSSCYHDGGHGVPQKDPGALSEMVEWIQREHQPSSSKL